MPLFALSLFLTNPAPLEMPRAEAYLVRDGSRSYLEDRFDRADLWLSRAVDGRWVDDEGRVFTLATLLATRDPRQATAAAFRDSDTMTRFQAEWLRWWSDVGARAGR